MIFTAGLLALALLIAGWFYLYRKLMVALSLRRPEICAALDGASIEASLLPWRFLFSGDFYPTWDEEIERLRRFMRYYSLVALVLTVALLVAFVLQLPPEKLGPGSTIETTDGSRSETGYRVLLAGVFVWFGLCVLAFRRLRTRHPDLYEKLGRPSLILRNTPQKMFNFLVDFLYAREPGIADDTPLRILRGVMQLYLPGWLVLMFWPK